MSKQQPIKGNEVKNYFVRPRKKKNDRSILLFLGHDLTKNYLGTLVRKWKMTVTKAITRIARLENPSVDEKTFRLAVRRLKISST